METRKIIEKSEEYFMLTNSNFVLENRNTRTYALGEVIQTGVILYDITKSNRGSMLQLENILIDNKIPFQHQKKN